MVLLTLLRLRPRLPPHRTHLVRPVLAILPCSGATMIKTAILMGIPLVIRNVLAPLTVQHRMGPVAIALLARTQSADPNGKTYVNYLDAEILSGIRETPAKKKKVGHIAELLGARLTQLNHYRAHYSPISHLQDLLSL